MIDRLNFIGNFKYGYDIVEWGKIDDGIMIMAIYSPFSGDLLAVFDESEESQKKAWLLTSELYCHII